MKITIKHYNKTISLETENDDLTMDNLISEIIIPMLKAMGFAEKTINEYFDVG